MGDLMDSSKYLILLAAVAALAVGVQAGLSPESVPFLVNTVTAGAQRQPDVGVAGDGRALIVWDSDVSGDAEIAGRLVNAAGTVEGEEFRISPPDDSSHIRPVVGGFPGTGFVVAWENYVFDTDDDKLLVQRLDSSGNPVGNVIAIDDTEFHYDADVAVVADGGFVVVWGDGFDVLARRFDALGGSIGDFFAVNEQLGTMYGPRIAANASGAFAVVWEDRSSIDGDGDGIMLRRFNSDGSSVGGDLQVNSTAEGDQYAPAIAMRTDGAFVVVWETYGQDSVGDGSFGQVFAADGNRVGDEFRVDAGDSAFAGYVDAVASGEDFIVLWSEPPSAGSEILNTLMRRFDFAGTGGGVIDVDPQEQGDQALGALASFGNTVMVAWQGFGPDENDVFAQRFGPLDEPQSCAGDCDGSGAVSIAELVRAVNIALGVTDVATCTAADRNGDGTVAINELIAAVNSALFACS
jgi:hypothetical protein